MEVRTRPWFGSSDVHRFRLHRGDSDNDENLLFSNCRNRATQEPLKSFRGLPYIGSGWEYSVFDDGQAVVKTPATRFQEVGSAEYFENAQQNYAMLVEFLGDEFVAETTFESDGTIRQVKLRNGQPRMEKMIEVVKRLIRLLDERLWIPDVELSISTLRSPKNILIDGDGTPKLIDFTTYYDVFRLSPKRLLKEIANKGGELLAILGHDRLRENGIKT